MFKYLILLIVFSSSIVNGKIIKSEEWDLNLIDMKSSSKANSDSECNSVELLEYPTHVAGYIELEGTVDSHIFYMYFQNRYRRDDAPFLL